MRAEYTADTICRDGIVVVVVTWISKKVLYCNYGLYYSYNIVTTTSHHRHHHITGEAGWLAHT